MKKNKLGPLALRSLLLLLSAAGGYAAGNYPAEVSAFCAGVR